MLGEAGQCSKLVCLYWEHSERKPEWAMWIFGENKSRTLCQGLAPGLPQNTCLQVIYPSHPLAVETSDISEQRWTTQLFRTLILQLWAKKERGRKKIKATESLGICPLCKSQTTKANQRSFLSFFKDVSWRIWGMFSQGQSLDSRKAQKGVREILEWKVRSKGVKERVISLSLKRLSCAYRWTRGRKDQRELGTQSNSEVFACSTRNWKGNSDRQWTQARKKTQVLVRIFCVAFDFHHYWESWTAMWKDTQSLAPRQGWYKHTRPDIRGLCVCLGTQNTQSHCRLPGRTAVSGDSCHSEHKAQLHMST